MSEKTTPDPGKTTVILPTFNERESLPLVLREIDRHCAGIRVLVVDDNSPDGTGQLADELKSLYPRMEVLHRKKKTGLGDAYREAFRTALDRGADYIVTMDTDLSHDPAYLPEIIRGLTGSDLVVGSRYTRGVSIVNWPLRRLMLSQFGNWYARRVTGLTVRDCTSGFMGFRRRVLETIPFHLTGSRGYCFIVELKYLAHLAGFSLAEVPIIFFERREGRSKMSAGIALEAFWKVLLLRLGARRYLRLMRRPDRLR